ARGATCEEQGYTNRIRCTRARACSRLTNASRRLGHELLPRRSASGALQSPFRCKARSDEFHSRTQRSLVLVPASGISRRARCPAYIPADRGPCWAPWLGREERLAISRRGRLFARLQAVQRGVLPALREQLGVGSGRDDAAARNDVDHIGVAHRREPVRDDDTGASDREALQ